MAESRNVRIGALPVLWALALCTVASSFAQTAAPATPAPEPPAADRNPAAQRFLDDRLAVWRQRLKLEDWQISVVMTRDLPLKTLGGIKWDKTKKTAVIWALDPSAYRLPFRAILDDLELTLVHELVHLDLSSLPRGQASRSSEERAVDGIAAALLGLDHKNQ
ncbi:MAG TPA: hypothetical protein VN841_20395 [Bryobacteraceae bacterium]|nr:hypothetical protein [Bryobacteraceae bacterium]